MDTITYYLEIMYTVLEWEKSLFKNPWPLCKYLFQINNSLSKIVRYRNAPAQCSQSSTNLIEYQINQIKLLPKKCLS